MLAIIAGVDLCEIEGISDITALELLSETGTDMGKWQSSKHFAAWVNLAPNTKITGGKIISSKMQRKKNHAGLSLRMAASNLSTSKSPMGDYARKMKGRLGKKGGVVATGHKLSRIIYTMLKEKRPYDKEMMDQNQKNWKEKQIKYLEKRLEQLKKVS
jgi:transposase